MGDELEWRKTHIDSRVEVSRCGRVRKKINGNHPERRQFLVYKPETDKDGYLRIRLLGQHIRVHRLVYETFNGELIDGLVICHLDGSITNNDANNLAQVTQKENISHKAVHGTMQVGERHGMAKVTDAKMMEVMRDYMSATSDGKRRHGAIIAIARRHGISPHIVYDLRRGRWSHVKC